MKMSSHKRTTVTSIHVLVVLVILISRRFSVLEAILVPCCCSCILFWLLKRNTHRVTLRKSVMKKEKKPPHFLPEWKWNSGPEGIPCSCWGAKSPFLPTSIVTQVFF